ncbi:helix-turn-helix domain-containing protein [Microbacterium sp.]|uniref:helix-turn-helix domain-containing protein n=1 Tax=Microbacterium sp. TaxID=51671 RepID=UPI003C76A6E3
MTATKANPVTQDDIIERYGYDREQLREAAEKLVDQVRGERLKELRRSLGLTQVEVAKRLGVSQNRVSLMERGDLGQLRIDTLRRYAEAFGVDLRIDLLAGDRIASLA